MCYAQQDGATQTGVRPELKLLRDWTNDENITNWKWFVHRINNLS